MLMDWEEDWLKPSGPKAKVRKHSDATKRVLSEKQKARNATPMAGKKHSRDARFKMSKTKLGRIAVHSPSGEVRFVTDEEANWLIMAEGWHKGRA